jgi:hypothetical protein
MIHSHESIISLSISSSSRHLLIQHFHSFTVWEAASLTLEQQTDETFPSAGAFGATFSPDDTMLFFICNSTIKIYEKG